MRLNLTQSFKVKGNIDRLFDLASSFLSELDFKVKSSEKPNTLVLKRGDAFGSLTSYRIENHKTTLAVSFSKKGKTVTVQCSYNVEGYGVFYTSNHKSILEGEVDELKDYLHASLQIP